MKTYGYEDSIAMKIYGYEDLMAMKILNSFEFT